MKLFPRGFLILCVVCLAGCLALPAASPVEPGAGSWQTWVVTDLAAVRPPAPPAGAATQAELQEVQTLVAGRDETALQQIAYWDAGSPSYRWLEIAFNQLRAKPLGVKTQRTLALLNVAIYDAMVTAWEAKYSYNRARPAVLAPGLSVLAQHTNSPSYPAEHAVAAGAAASILAYAYPDDGQLFMDKAEEAARSRVLAGAHFPSDVAAGLELGRQVAQLVIARADQDGSSATWDGVMPTEPGHWTGENPVDPNAAHWQPWLLSAADEFRPAPPLAYDSPELAAELKETMSYTRTWQSNQKALYWQTFDGIFATWYDFATLRIFEQGLDANPPQAARIYALLGVAHFDALIACWDAKYTYWSIRPHQLEPTLVPLFPVPNHPSYPSAHSCLSGAMAEVLAYAFPASAEAIHARAIEAGESRIWGGLHFRSDISAGLAIGEAVGQKVIEHARQDGAMASQ